MSKRYIFPQQYGDRKKAKLDVSISDHNFPLSQNSSSKNVPETKDTWGDDNDDEILLLASQACEQAYANDISTLPDYSMCMQPRSTSTQLYDQASTSKTAFTFKKPTATTSIVPQSNQKDKMIGLAISSPLPGISNNVTKNDRINLTDDLIFNDKIYKGQDSEYLYRQLLQLQEENTKLKSENGKLLEKCVTKEGEASILRTQLKSSQIAVDNVRMEKLKVQEKVQMDYNEKLTAVNGQMQELRNQLDFKNLEIISIKEKCKMLESSKVKLTQVMVPSNDISTSHKTNMSIVNDINNMNHGKRLKMISSTTQTKKKALRITLIKTSFTDENPLQQILPLTLEPTTDSHSILDYNQKLQKQSEFNQNQCKVLSTFHRIPSAPQLEEERYDRRISMSCIHEDLTSIAMEDNCDKTKCFNIFRITKMACEELMHTLEQLSQRVTTAFQKEMDDKYVELTETYIPVQMPDLVKGTSLFNEEQAILLRRLVATLSFIFVNSRSFSLEHFKDFDENSNTFYKNIFRICCLINGASCALLYSGLLLSIVILFSILLQRSYIEPDKVLEIVHLIVITRPMPFVSYEVLKLVQTLTRIEGLLDKSCPKTSTGNLRLDYDQGVLLYRKDSCFLQILLKQIEVSLYCIEKQNLILEAVQHSQQLIALYNNTNLNEIVLSREKSKCECHLALMQAIVYSLRICAVMLNNMDEDSPHRGSLLALCRSGTQILYRCSQRDMEFSSQLAHCEGLAIHFTSLTRRVETDELYLSMLSELAGTLQTSPEDSTASIHRQAWINSFDNFSITD